MSRQLDFLHLIIEELLPFVRGDQLSALALTCRWLHRRIFQSKKWKALPMIKKRISGWHYGTLIAPFFFYCIKHIQDFECWRKYFETGLPMEIHLCYNDYPQLIATNDLWFIRNVTFIRMINSSDFESLVHHGLLPENLEYLGLEDLNVPREILSRLTRLKILKLESVSRKFSLFNVLPRLNKLEIKTHNLDCRHLQPLNSVTVLSIHARSMKNPFSLRGWKNLKELTIWAPVEDISFLEFLDELEFCELNKRMDKTLLLTKFPSNPPKKLKTFILTHMKNGNLDFLSGWTCLETLRVRSTEIMNIDALETCINLKKFDCAQVNQLKPLAKCLNLVELSLEKCIQNDWESLSGLPNLQCVQTYVNDGIPESFSKLSLSRLKIKSDSSYVSRCNVTLSEERQKELSHFELSRISLSSVTFLEYVTGLTSLKLTFCLIQDIQPLSQLVQLEVLDLSNNWIDNISPLAGLLKLKDLNLQENNIVDIQPLSHLLELEKLDLSSNNIKDIRPLFGLKKVFILDLSSNKNVIDTDKKKLMLWKYRSVKNMNASKYLFEDSD